jgi:hypothetical protein
MEKGRSIVKYSLKILFFILIAVLLIFFIIKTVKQPIHDVQQTPTPTTTNLPTAPNKKEITFANKTYAFAYFTVSDLTKLILVPNFKEKLSSLDIMTTHACTSGVNGGFYNTENEPLGGFMANGIMLKKPVRNRLIDGFLWVKGANASISLSNPPDDAKFFLQTGPLFMVNGGVTKISIANDEYKRRMVAGITKEGILLFLVLYNPDSVYEGPLLSDMPAIMTLLDKQTSFVLKDIVNLDGGSASAFVSKEITLQEFSPVGSFLCIL